MLRTQLRLTPRPGCFQAVLDLYEDRGILTRSLEQPGCLSAEIWVSLPSEDGLTVSAVWESLEHYQGWTDNPSRAADVAELLPLLELRSGELGSAELFTIYKPRVSATQAHVAGERPTPQTRKKDIQ